MSADAIELRGLRFSTLCGVLPEERERRQPIEIDLDVMTDLSRAGSSDDLHDTVDYGALCARVEQVVESGAPQLLEFLAEQIASAVLTDDRIDAVIVSVRKLRPPVGQQLDTSGVRVSRTRPDRAT